MKYDEIQLKFIKKEKKNSIHLLIQFN